MELHAFGHYMRDRVRAFEKYWREAMVDDRTEFPEEMDQTDWEDQFATFLEINQ